MEANSAAVEPGHTHRSRQANHRAAAYHIRIVQTSRPILSHSRLSAGHGMVVAQHADAARAGVEVLQAGGNAVDAAVTAAFSAGVLLPLWNGIGGGGLMVVHMADGSGGAVDFGAQAPALATPDMYALDEGYDISPVSRRYCLRRVRDQANAEGYTSIAVPGTVAGLSAALTRWGTIGLDRAVAPAVEWAREGAPLGRTAVLTMVSRHELLCRFPATRAVYTRDGVPLSVGHRFVQPEYADALERIGADGPEVFYRGKLADRIDRDMRAHGGLLRRSDLEQYRPILHDTPLSGLYRGHRVDSVPASCGGPTALEILHILDRFDLAAMGLGTPEYLHTLIEAVKLAAVDRFTYLGDPALHDIPLEALADPRYAATRAAQLDPERAGDYGAGDPWAATGRQRPPAFPAAAGSAPDRGTTHVTTVDAHGNAVALTQTNLGFSGVVVPGVGAMMNNAMAWACPTPGTVNSIAPLARPLNNMTPLIVHRDGEVRLAIGASGGRRIWPAVVQSIVHHLDFGLDLQGAIEAPRIHAESDAPVVDPRLGDAAIEALRQRGHDVQLPSQEWALWPFAEPNGISRASDRDGDGWSSGVSPAAKPAHAAGY